MINSLATAAEPCLGDIRWVIKCRVSFLSERDRQAKCSFTLPKLSSRCDLFDSGHAVSVISLRFFFIHKSLIFNGLKTIVSKRKLFVAIPKRFGMFGA